MHRIFGRAKLTEPAAPAAPAPSLDGHVTKLNSRTEDLDKKIAAADQELLQIKGQLAKTRLPAQQSSLKQRALQILKRKQMYTSQRDQMMQRAFNLEQTQFAIDSMKEAKDTIDVMRCVVRGKLSISATAMPVARTFASRGGSSPASESFRSLRDLQVCRCHDEGNDVGL